MAIRRSVRRAPTPRQLAAYKSVKQKIDEKEKKKQALRKLARGIQEFALLSINELVDRGPGWSGEFAASWGFAPAGQTPRVPGGEGQIPRYNKNNIRVTEIEKYLKNGTDKFAITNISPHANIAIDEEVAKFIPIGDAIKPVVRVGTRPPEPEHLRPDFGEYGSGGKEGSITAEEFWFQKYMDGGFLQRDLSKGVSLGFNGSLFA